MVYLYFILYDVALAFNKKKEIVCKLLFLISKLLLFKNGDLCLSIVEYNSNLAKNLFLFSKYCSINFALNKTKNQKYFS